MECKECYWCKSNKSLSQENRCCNKESPNYNEIVSEFEKDGCEYSETEQAVDYKNMTAWQFASKYYM